MKEPQDAYKVLQVDPEADLEVIQAAYRRLAQKYHPDRVAPGPDGETGAARMVEINAAWAMLRDPARRAAYDRQRSHPPAPSSPMPQGPAGATSGRSPRTAQRPYDATGSAGPSPGRPSGSILNFGRYSGWSLGEVGRQDPGYLEWLDRMPIGRPYRAELDILLRRLGRRLAERTEARERHGLFRRR